MKIAITGGHISPALAVLDKLAPETEVVFFGRKTAFENGTAPSYEYQEISKRKIKFISVKTGRLQRVVGLSAIFSLAKIPRGVGSSYWQLKNEKPDVVVSFGGYIGLSVALAARLHGIPVVIHEQTLKAGLSNKIVGKFADKICISWESSRKYFPKHKTVLTGNPLRPEFSALKAKDQTHHSPPLIYVTGGSAGSHELNLLIEKNLTDLLRDYKVIHQTGQAEEFNDFTRLKQIRDSLTSELKNRYVLTKFTTALEAADHISESELVISRAGINAVTEFIYFAKKAYLVPLIYGQRGEQQSNARMLYDLGLAEIYSENENFVLGVTKMIQGSYKLKDKQYFELIIQAPERIKSVIYEAAKKP